MKRPEQLSKLEELLYQVLETEMGGEAVYAAAVTCSLDRGLEAAWQAKLEDAGRHKRVLTEILEQLGLACDRRTGDRQVSRRLGDALVSAIERAARISPEAAQEMAIECVILAETRQVLGWEKLRRLTDETVADDSEPLHM